VLGTLPHNLIGLIDDWMLHVRVRRWFELQGTDRTLRARGIENREQVSPSGAIPLIEAAINEDRAVLKELWAKLLANALSDLAQMLGTYLQVPRDEAHLSLEHLYELRCLAQSPDEVPRPPVTVKGKALMRAVSD
jgi:hypothetical protein